MQDPAMTYIFSLYPLLSQIFNTSVLMSWVAAADEHATSLISVIFVAASATTHGQLLCNIPDERKSPNSTFFRW